MEIQTYDKIKSIKEQKYIFLALHGYGSSKEDMRYLVSSLKKACNNEDILDNITFIIPNAPLEEEGGYKWFNLCFIEDENENNTRIKIKDINGFLQSNKTLQNFIQQISKELNCSTENIFLFGFSQGGIMALYQALHTKPHYLGIIGHSTVYFEHDTFSKEFFNTIQKDQNILLIHGMEDKVLPFDPFMKNTISFFDEEKIKYKTFFKQELGHYVDNSTINATLDFIKNSIEFDK